MASALRSDVDYVKRKRYCSSGCQKKRLAETPEGYLESLKLVLTKLEVILVGIFEAP